jgi:hypothetical protein
MTVYLLAKYYKVPRDPRQTGKRDYMKNPENFAWDENVKFARNLGKNDLSDHNVVLNIFDQRVEKCNMPDMMNMDYQQMFAFYYANYRSYFDRMFEAVGLKVDVDRVNEQGEVVAAVTAEETASDAVTEVTTAATV